ncbi:MAG: SPL family radical SAM protein [Treponema sp.]
MHFVNARTILSSQNGINIYRGCTHGCIYCDTRSDCYHTPKPIEDVEVKQNAPELLEAALKKKRAKCMIGTGSMCDPYMPCESKLELTRRCIETVSRHGFGFTVLTKSDLILRDLNLLKEINQKTKCVVQITMTTFDDELCKIIEPNVCVTSRRFEILKICQQNNIPTVVWLTPFLPGINDTFENVKGLMDYCVSAQVRGIICPAIGLTLRQGNREYFYEKLDEHFKGLKEFYIQTYGNSYGITSRNNKPLMQYIHQICARHNIICSMKKCFEYLHEFPQKNNFIQYELF